MARIVPAVDSGGSVDDDLIGRFGLLDQRVECTLQRGWGGEARDDGDRWFLGEGQ